MTLVIGAVLCVAILSFLYYESEKKKNEILQRELKQVKSSNESEKASLKLENIKSELAQNIMLFQSKKNFEQFQYRAQHKIKWETYKKSSFAYSENEFRILTSIDESLDSVTVGITVIKDISTPEDYYRGQADEKLEFSNLPELLIPDAIKLYSQTIETLKVKAQIELEEQLNY